MREIRIYQPGDYQVGDLLELSPEAGQHVAVVLRMQVGWQLTLFNGANKECKVIIDWVKKKQVKVLIQSEQEISRESPLSIHLAQAISKGDRMDWVMQKSVELGVASIRPLISERCSIKLDSERLDKKLHQWQNIVIAACEQSGRNTVPIVHPPLDYAKYMIMAPSSVKFILDPQANKTWKDYTMNFSDATLLIGPEGGFTDEEIFLASRHDFLPLSLGPRVLRTETATITALSILQAAKGDL